VFIHPLAHFIVTANKALTVDLEDQHLIVRVDERPDTIKELAWGLNALHQHGRV
jgi:hypothetical protein